MRFSPWMLCLSLCVPSLAHAYCRTTNAELTRRELLSTECVTRGEPLFWGERSLRYAFHPTLRSADLDDMTVRTVVREAFATWESVECDGESYHLEDSGELATERTANYERGANNLNAILFQSQARWDELGNDPAAYALTTLAYEAATGEILGADIEINEGRGPYTVCPGRSCSPNALLTDLPNVITHEAGHFLGLAHSDEADSTMFYRADPWETNKRSLADDDRAGLCAIVEDEREAAQPPSDSDGCSVGLSQKPGLSALWLLGLCFVARRRGRAGDRGYRFRARTRMTP